LNALIYTQSFSLLEAAPSHSYMVSGLSNFIVDSVVPFNRWVRPSTIRDDTLYNVCQPYSLTNMKNRRYLYQDPYHCFQMHYVWRVLTLMGVHEVAFLNTVNDVLPHWSIGLALSAMEH
jgi:hypothetical protein